jgi:uncharacterized repeat protein (TIGR01451 family)/fimbrial isopeptide formation D2 family protein
VLALAFTGVVVAVPTPAAAAGTISLDKSSSGPVLLGGQVEYRLAATNPAGSGVEQYNLSFSDVLPVGVTYVAGSTSPSNYGEPQVITITDDAAATPPVTHHVLVWSNVSDLTPGATRTLTFRASVDPDVYPIGSSVTNTGSAFSSSDPREVPDFDGQGQPLPGTEVVSSSDADTTTVTAIRLTKSEGSPENELLRGVNDHQTVYGLTVTNNGVDSTSSLVVTDFLPAGLEFLGCGGGSFNSTTPEYPGASNAVAAVSGCDQPDSVETVENPAGQPAGVYTKVVWQLSDLTAGATHTIHYAAGIPQRANTMTWSGTEPSASSGDQAANLDNNNGGSTRETATEIGLRNEATVSGAFEGAPVEDSASHSVTAEDLRLVKSVTPTTFTQGELATYTLSIDTSEYVDLSDLVVTDRIPDGLCPIDDATNWTSLAECAGRAGHGPTNATITGVTENADGSFSVTFTPDATALAHNGHLEITYQALMRETYGASGPTSASDSFTNNAVITGTSDPRTDTDSPDTGSVTVSDDSHATITASGPQLTKLRMKNATPMRCSDDVNDYTATVTGSEDAFSEGDRVCFLLEVRFPAGADTRNAQLTDFLPANIRYESSHEVSPGSLIASSSADDRYVTWTLGSGSPLTVARGTLFRVVVSGIVDEPAPLESTTSPKALDKDNLAKFRYTNTDGQSDSLRDSVTIPIGPPPPIGLTKGVQAVNSTVVDGGSTPGNVDGTTVRAGDAVTFRIDLHNLATSGDVNADAITSPDVWDVLPAGITCSAITAVSNAGTCYDAGAPGRPGLSSGDTTSSVIRWELDASFSLAPQAYGKLTYTMAIPADVSVSTVFDNTAAVASFASATNIDDGGTPPVAIHNPADNVSADVSATDEDVPAASDTSSVVVPDAEVTKANVTDITEPGNTVAQAVVGETLTYTIGVTIPAHTSVYNGTLVDPLPTGVVFVGPATAKFSATGTSPAADPLPNLDATHTVTIDDTTGTLSFGTTYINDTDTDQLFEVTIPARIGTDPTNTHGTVRRNTATFTSDTAATSGTPITPRTASSNLTIVTPAPALTKTVSPTSATGGDTVTYTLTASNASGRPPLHDTWVIDCLPGELGFGAFTTIPSGTSVGAVVAGDGSNGCASGYTRITWQINNLAGGASSTLVYAAVVNTVPAGGDQYTNTATLSGSTLNDGKTDPLAPNNPLEQVLTSTATATVSVAGSAITKTAAQSTLTIGQVGSFTITVTVPKNTAFYDSAVLDTLPTGMSYVTGSSTTTCTNADSTSCSPALPGTELTPSGSVVGWLTGDLDPSSQVRTIRITYDAKMNDVAGNTAGTNRTNTARAVWNKTNGTDPGGAGGTWDATTTDATAMVRVVEPGLTIAKAVNDTTVEPGQTFTYTVTARNNGRTTTNLSPAYNYTVTDTIPAGVVVDPATISNGGTLTGTDANGSGGTITWGPIAGPLAVSASTSFTYSAKLAPSSTLTSSARTNTARVTHYESLASGGRTSYAPVSATRVVTPQFPHVTPTKSVAAGPAYLGQPKTWTVTLTNDGGADARHSTATDTLPMNWTYDAGSATVVVAGGAANPVEPTLSSDGSGHQVLAWADLGTIPAAGTNRTIVITFTATPKDPDAITDPGVGASVAHTNSVATTAQDATGATANASGPYNASPATASTHIDSADVQITKTSGTAVAGQNLTYTLVVHNNGPDTAVGPFPVTDSLPSGLGTVTATGTGWTCSVSTTTVTCARANPADTLASGASFPAITVTAAIPAGTADGTTLTNSASVSSTTYDPDLTNNTDQVTDTIARSVDLGIVKHTSGTVTAGLNATYTLDVTNHGPSDSAGPIRVTDTLPGGTNFVSANGTGWSCTQAAGTLTCDRSAGLTSGQAAPQITVVVSVPAGRTAQVVNTASVSGPETDPVPANNTSTVTDPVATVADLALIKVHQGEFVPGSTATYHFTVTNHGPSDAAAPVRVTDQLEPELTFVSDDSADWSCSANASNLLTCTLTGDLGVGDSSEFGITVAIDSAHTGDVTNSATVSSPTTDPNTGNNTDDDTTAVNVRVDLGIVKSHSGDAVAGRNLAFSLVVTNHGESDSPVPVVVTDTLPAGMSYVSGTGGGWSCSAAGQAVTCTHASGLASGANSTITLTVALAPDAGPATLSNSASVSGPAPDPRPANNTDTDTVTVGDEANVSIAKSASPTTVAAGGAVTFTLTVHNDGPSDADNVQVSDALPPGLSFVSVDPDAAVTCNDADPIDCQVASMPAGATYQIRVHARVGSGVADGERISNTATVSTSTPGDNPDDNSDTATITVSTAADLSIIKTHSGTSVAAGEQVTFQLAVHNDGPSDAAADVVVTDTLPVGMTYVSSTGTGWTCVAATPDASGQTVTCTLGGGGAILADTDAPALALTVQIASDVDPDTLVDGVLTNTASVTSPTTDPDPDNNTDHDPVPVTTSADLSIAKTHDASSVRVGDHLEFTLQVTNAGPSTARGVSVSDDLPAGLEYVSASGTGWTCTNADQSISCDLDDPLASGASAAPITVVVSVLASAFPGVDNTATVDGTTPDPEAANNTSTDPVTVPPQVDLGVTKSHTPEPMQVGQQATYTIGVSNAGNTDDPGPITVSDTLPAGLTFLSGTGDGWACSASGQDVACVRAAGLVMTGNTSIDLIVQVGPEAYPGVTNVATVSSPAADTNPSNNTAQDPATVLPLYDLVIDKSLKSISTSHADWTIAVTNNGPNESPSGAVITDELPTKLRYDGWTGDGWTCVATGRLVTCTYDQAIAAGESVGLILHTTFVDGASGTVTNSATVEGGTTDSATGTIPTDNLAYTGGIAAGAGLLGLLLVGGGLLLIRTRRRA